MYNFIFIYIYYPLGYSPISHIQASCNDSWCHASYTHTHTHTHRPPSPTHTHTMASPHNPPPSALSPPPLRGPLQVPRGEKGERGGVYVATYSTIAISERTRNLSVKQEISADGNTQHVNLHTNTYTHTRVATSSATRNSKSNTHNCK